MLKNITLSVLCVLGMHFTAKAQFSLDNDSLFVDGDCTEFELIIHNNIRNTTSNPDTIVWTRAINTFSSGVWESAVCDINTCYPPNVNSQEFILAPNSVGDLSFHFYPKNEKGTAKMVVRFAKKSNPSYFIDLLIDCQCYGLGIRSVANPTFKIFPNPATKSITLGNEKIKEGTFEIFNLIGEKLMNNTFSNGQKIDVSSLAKGIYIVTIKNENSVASTKLIVE